MASTAELLDHRLISQGYFFPRPDAPDDPVHVPVDGATLACAHHPVDGATHTVVHFHGNGETVADYLPHFADHLNAIGLNAFFVEYRGYGQSTSSPGLARILDDGAPIVEHLGLPPSQLIPLGRSIGSIYAIHMASLYPDVAGLILDSPIADVLERVLLRVSPCDLGTTYNGVKHAVQQHFDHQQKMANYRGPLLILHAQNDRLVDASHAGHLNAWSASLQHRLVLFERGGHNDLFAQNKDEYLRHLRLFFALHAK